MKLQLSSPINPLIITQHFGGNGEYYQANGIQVIGHNGTDCLAFHGQPIYAPMDGTAYYELDDGGGHGVVIISDKVFEYKDTQAVFKIILWHLCDPKETKYASPIWLAVGRKANTGKGVPVKQGDLVGFADSTGLSTGDHLHFGLKPITTGKAPLSGDAPDVGIGDWVNIEQKNGYLGAINPEPYLNGTFVSTAATPPATGTFSRDLYLGLTGEDVRALQVYLNAHNCTVAASGAGSPGKETTYYGLLTQRALMKFQAKNNITPVAGYFGPKSRAFVAMHP